MPCPVWAPGRCRVGRIHLLAGCRKRCENEALVLLDLVLFVYVQLLKLLFGLINVGTCLQFNLV